MKHTPITNPPWVVAKIDQRLAKAGTVLPALPVNAVILMALTEPPDNCTPAQYKTWDRSCDCCGVYVPDTGNFYTGQSMYDHHGQRIRFTFGVCEMCKVKTTGA